MADSRPWWRRIGYLPDLTNRRAVAEVRSDLDHHIKVPSWWNRRTDDRIREIEKAIWGEAKYPPLPREENDD